MGQVLKKGSMFVSPSRHWTTEEHLRRKKASALVFDIRKDSKGNVLNPESVSRASQSKADECDINKIMARVEKGQFPFDPFSGARERVYADFASMPADFQAALDLSMRVKDEFMALDPQLRARFENDPKKLLDFLDKAENQDEAVKLGLLMKPRFETVKVQTKDGDFWVTKNLVNGIEVKREKVIAVSTPEKP